MIFDLFIMAPVVLFLLWLYWYSTPNPWPRSQVRVDWLIVGFGLLGSFAVLAGLHAYLDSSVQGLSRNVIAVASSYLFFIFVLGAGWIRRFRKSAA